MVHEKKKKKKKEKGEEKESQTKTEQGETRINTYTHTEQNKITENKERIKKPHPGKEKEGGYGGSKGQRFLARGRPRSVERDDG